MITLLLACADPVPVEATPATALVSIAVEPTELTIVTGLEGADPVQFVALGTTANGEEQELGTVEGTVSNRSAGETDDDGLFTPAAGNGGVTWVVARLDGVEGTSTLTVLFEDELNLEGLDTTPFETGTIAGEQEFWLYPEDGVSLPRNTPAWSSSASSRCAES